MALITLSPILLMASRKVKFDSAVSDINQPSYAALAIVTREITVINMWAGQFFCEAFNLVVKRIVKQGRPPGTQRYHRLPSVSEDLTRSPSSGSVANGYGFPSSHGQYMGYFATFLILHLHFRHKFAPGGSFELTAFRVVIYPAIITWAGIVAYSR
jgi:dolichyldiphosphatase